MAKIGIYRRKTGFSPFSDPSALEKSFGDRLEIFRLIEARDMTGLERLIEAHWGEEFIVRDAPAPKKRRPARAVRVRYPRRNHPKDEFCGESRIPIGDACRKDFLRAVRPLKIET